MKRLILLYIGMAITPIVWIAFAPVSLGGLYLDLYKHYLSGEPFGVFDGGLDA